MTSTTGPPQPPFQPLIRGEPAPWFSVPALSGSPNYAFHTVAGRHVLLLFLGSAGLAPTAAALKLVRENRSLFNDRDACFFGITCDPADSSEGRIAQDLPGIRFLLDHNRQVSSLYGAVSGTSYRPFWLLIDPMLRVLGQFPVDQGTRALAMLRQELGSAPTELHAPILVVPNILPKNLCAELIAGYRTNGGTPSGFMRDVEGKTRLLLDPSHKQRSDWTITDAQLRQKLTAYMQRTLTVPIQRAFQFTPTRIERYIVGCYTAEAGHFRPHRDNTTKGTAHRRFAVTINLNAEDYDGGDLRFPEFGSRTYRAPTGGAAVFSCSLLHEATPVTRGERFAFLPFLYDEEAARVREANSGFLDRSGDAYAADQAAAGTS
jgi:predicted 2-oxoglutarate/Fe(II)-dependent dioxygenase YbiX/peroxiredoxin